MGYKWLEEMCSRPTNEQICWSVLNDEIDIIDAAELIVSSDDWEFHLAEEAEVLNEMLEMWFKRPQEREKTKQKYRDDAIKAFFHLLDVLTMPPVPEAESPVKHPIPRSTPQEWQ